MQVGDLVRIKGGQEVVLVIKADKYLSDWDQMKVLRAGQPQYIRKSQLVRLEVISESR